MRKQEINKFNKTLSKNKLTIICAESITAGMLASTIASIPGASSILKGSIVTYDRELKSAVLKVNPGTIDKHSAESLETTIEMVYGLMKLYPSSDLYVAVTGIASPGTEKYPVIGEVGDIFVAVYYKHLKPEFRLQTYSTRIASSERNKIREEAVRFIFAKVSELVS